MTSTFFLNLETCVKLLTNVNKVQIVDIVKAKFYFSKSLVKVLLMLGTSRGLGSEMIKHDEQSHTEFKI